MGQVFAEGIEFILQVCPSTLGQQLRTAHYRQAGNLHQEQILIGGSNVFRSVVIKANQHETRQRHELPKRKNHHIMSLVLSSPYMPPRNNRKYG